MIEYDARAKSPTQEEAADPEPDRTEDLDTLAIVRSVGYDKRTVGRHRNRGRIDDAPRLRSDLDDRHHARSLCIDSIYGMSATIEHEVLTRCRSLESRRFPEMAGDLGRDGADR